RELSKVRGAEIELPVTVAGTSRVFHRDEPGIAHRPGQADPSSEYTDQLITATNRVLTLHLDADVSPGSRIDVSGYRLGDDVFVFSGPGPFRGSVHVDQLGAATDTIGEVDTR